MNENSAIKNLLQKFILNQCTQEEANKVVEYYRANQLTDDFPTVEDIKAIVNDASVMSESTADKIFSNIMSQSNTIETKQVKTIRKSYLRYIAVAASIAVLCSVGFLSYQNGLFNSKEPMILTGNEITLQLANGEVQVISEGKNRQLTDADGNVLGNQNGNKIAYDNNTKVDKLVYNTLKVPYGKRFELQLSDGTMVHLNAGTTLKYPVKFIAGENRQVFLDGEAFFDVTKDKKHPFVVNADELNVRVLGTHFNVSSYPEDDATDVVLVEGSVGLYTVNENFDVAKNTVLKPGFKGSFNKTNNKIDTKSVDPSIYISWMKGDLTFKNMTFKNIMKKLERHYDVTIVNKNIKLSEEKFSASFKDQSIVKVLSYFSEIQGFNFKVTNKQILIN